jgi:citrate lyase subunit beta/citryl-CoA lyase
MPDSTQSRRDAKAWQTVLFVPGDRRDMLCKAQQLGADAILVDLEDAVAPDAKPAARALLAELLSDGSLHGPSAVAVRVNTIGEGIDDDLTALRDACVAAIVVPKIGDAEAIRGARKAIDRQIRDGTAIGLVPQVESVKGVISASELTTTPGVSAIAFGGEDFCVDLGVSRSEAAIELLIPRALLALHARAANLPALDTVYTAIEDEAGLVREAQAARQLGYSGKLLVHPSQIDPVRRVFTPSSDELDWARRIVDSPAARQENGGAVAVVDGKMVDAPVIAQAERILARER